MNNRLIIDQVGMLFVAACLLTGCNHSSTPVDRPTDPLEQSAGLKKVIFYVAGMNQRLKIS